MTCCWAKSEGEVTESQWIACPNSLPMLLFVRDSEKASDRKLRLAAAACCRLVWPELRSKASRRAVELAEERADGPVRDEVVETVVRASREAVRMAGGATANATEMAYKAVLSDGPYAAASTVGYGPDAAREAAVLRDIFGPLPFREVHLDPSLLSWNDATLPRLAQSIYDDRILPEGTFDPERLAVLCDALEEASCRNEVVLEHLRGPGPHVRGCWVVDLLLRKG